MFFVELDGSGSTKVVPKIAYNRQPDCRQKHKSGTSTLTNTPRESHCKLSVHPVSNELETV